MNSHFKNFEKDNTGKIGVWDVKKQRKKTRRRIRNS